MAADHRRRQSFCQHRRPSARRFCIEVSIHGPPGMEASKRSPGWSTTKKLPAVKINVAIFSGRFDAVSRFSVENFPGARSFEEARPASERARNNDTRNIMTREKQETFRSLIEERMREAAAEIAQSDEDVKPISPDVSIGRLSRMDSMQMQQMALEARRRQQMLLVRLEEAMKRLDQGVFGSCLQCGADIAEDRLRYQPDAVLCMNCAR